jgi:hypothetical protein
VTSPSHDVLGSLLAASPIPAEARSTPEAPTSVRALEVLSTRTPRSTTNYDMCCAVKVYVPNKKVDAANGKSEVIELHAIDNTGACRLVLWGSPCIQMTQIMTATQETVIIKIKNFRIRILQRNSYNGIILSPGSLYGITQRGPRTARSAWYDYYSVKDESLQERVGRVYALS